MYCLALCLRLLCGDSPLLRLLLGEIGFVYPMMSMVVIGPSLPILRQRQWSLLYDDDGDSQQITGSKYLNKVQDQK
jgi:hypothetical protein